MLKEGTRVFIVNTSFDTTLAYQKYKNLGFPLLCPCHLNNTDELEITDILSKNLCLCRVVRNNKLTISCVKDLQKK